MLIQVHLSMALGSGSWGPLEFLKTGAMQMHTWISSVLNSLALKLALKSIQSSQISLPLLAGIGQPSSFSILYKYIWFDQHRLRGFVIYKDIRLKGFPVPVSSLKSSLNVMPLRRERDVYTGVPTLTDEALKWKKLQVMWPWRKKYELGNVHGSRKNYPQNSSRGVSLGRNKSPSGRAQAEGREAAIKHAVLTATAWV